MHLVGHLLAYALRQLVGDPAGRAVEVVGAYLTDHSQSLPKAVSTANDRAWKVLAVALSGDSWFNSLTALCFSSGDDRGMREEISRLVEESPIPFEGTKAEFRRTCLTELKHARKAGLLVARNLNARDIAARAAEFERYSDPHGLIDGSRRAIEAVADTLAHNCPNLANLLRLPTPLGPPLLVAAFGFFIRREIETNAELARGLTFEGLKQLATGQETALRVTIQALDKLGAGFYDRLDQILGQLDRIEERGESTYVVVTAAIGELAAIRRELREQADPSKSIGPMSWDDKVHKLQTGHTISTVRKKFSHWRTDGQPIGLVTFGSSGWHAIAIIESLGEPRYKVEATSAAGTMLRNTIPELAPKLLRYPQVFIESCVKFADLGVKHITGKLNLPTKGAGTRMAIALNIGQEVHSARVGSCGVFFAYKLASGDKCLGCAKNSTFGVQLSREEDHTVRISAPLGFLEHDDLGIEPIRSMLCDPSDCVVVTSHRLYNDDESLKAFLEQMGPDSDPAVIARFLCEYGAGSHEECMAASLTLETNGDSAKR